MINILWYTEPFICSFPSTFTQFSPKKKSLSLLLIALLLSSGGQQTDIYLLMGGSQSPPDTDGLFHANSTRIQNFSQFMCFFFCILRNHAKFYSCTHLALFHTKSFKEIKINLQSRYIIKCAFFSSEAKFNKICGTQFFMQNQITPRCDRNTLTLLDPNLMARK